jgi:penicillin-binding protein 2
MARYEPLKNLHREKNLFSSRIVVGALICFGLTLLLMARLTRLQVEDHRYYTTRADENRLRVTPVPPVRGLVFDRNGVVLAQNRPAFVLEVVPEQIQDMPSLLMRLGHLVQLTDADIARFEDRVRKTPRYRGVPLRNNLSMEEVARVEVNRHDLPGVEVTAGLTRNYPLGNSAAHVIGYVGGISETDLQRIDTNLYQGLAQIGKAGIERSHEDLLRGLPGAKIIEANAFGRPLRELDHRPGKSGQNLVLSVDARVQEVAEAALGELNGSVVALDPRNGEVIALVSKPGFDPHAFVEGIDVASYQALLSDRSRPLFNRALQGQYPPGSTVKPAMALAGLEYNITDPDHREFCGGSMQLPGSTRRYRCWRRQGHGWMDMVAGVMHSCDIYFYQLAMNLGIDRMHDAMTQFGLGARTGIDLPLESTGLMPSREWKRRTRGEPWYPGETLNIGIGQGYTLVTPLQLAQMTARIANRGEGFMPHILRATRDPASGDETPQTVSPLPPIVISNTRHWDKVIQAMIETAHQPGGTAYRVGRDAPYLIAAKTGTAQVAGLSQDEKVAPTLEQTPLHLRDHALFVAFAPADDPQVAVAVLAEHAGHGGAVSGPIARKVMDQYLLGEVRYESPPPVIPKVVRPSPRPTPEVTARAPD